MRRALALVLLAIALVGCSPTTSEPTSPQAVDSPSPRPSVTQWTPAPEAPLPELSEAEIALAVQIREAAIDDLNRVSDRSIIEISRQICQNLDAGITLGDLEAGFRQSRFNDDMIAAFFVPSVTALCPEHAGVFDDGDV
ncbi:DUF732 domain-containing protein [Microbacterium sp. LBN7]|uniref:DUF732 domain-containing protein n=1 Tax=Microbacterium sp. LBN7 TaxID=3129773 RepID=UPI00325166B4